MALFRLWFLFLTTTTNYKEEVFFCVTPQTRQLKLQIKSGDFLSRFFFFPHLTCVWECFVPCCSDLSREGFSWHLQVQTWRREEKKNRKKHWAHQIELQCSSGNAEGAYFHFHFVFEGKCTCGSKPCKHVMIGFVLSVKNIGLCYIVLFCFVFLRVLHVTESNFYFLWVLGFFCGKVV